MENLYPFNDAWLSLDYCVWLAALFGLLALFQTAGHLLALKIEGDWSHYQNRLKTGWIILLPLYGALLLGPWGFTLFWALITSLAIREILKIAPLHRNDAPLQYLLVGFPWLYTLTIGLGYSGIELFILALLVPPLWLLVRAPSEPWIARVGYVQWLLVQIAFPLGFMAWLCFDAPAHDPQVGKAAIPAWILFLVQFNQAMRYCFGKAIGRTPLFPTLAPTSSWEAVTASLLTTGLVGAFIGYEVTVLTFTESFLVTVLISLAGFFGSLMLSAIKQSLGIKEFSQLLRENGGLLDCLDSLLFALPIAYIALRHFN